MMFSFLLPPVGAAVLHSIRSSAAYGSRCGIARDAKHALAFHFEDFCLGSLIVFSRSFHLIYSLIVKELMFLF